MSEILGSTSQLQLTIPSALDTDWSTSIRDNCFQKIVDHDHTGVSGKGIQLTTSSITANAITETLIELTNNAYLVSANSTGSGDVSLIKANASDYIEFGAQIAAATLNNNVYLKHRNAADSADLDIIKANAFDLIEFGTEIGTVAFRTNGTSFVDNSDNTKIMDFDVSAITTGTTRTITVPDADVTLWSNPMTTSGDVVYGGASGVGTRLAKGTDGEVLTLSSGVPSWAEITATPIAAQAKTTTYTVLTTDSTLTLDPTSGGFTTTLYTASGNSGRRVTFVNIGTANTATIEGDGSETIDGALNVLLINQNQSLTVESDGTNWLIVAESAGTTSFLQLQTSNGYGSPTGTKIKRYTTITTNVGTAMTYADSATSGMSVTVNETGIYHIGVQFNVSGAASIGLSVNSSQLSTSITTITDTDRLSMQNGAANGYDGVANWAGVLTSGDVVRAHSAGSASNNASNESFFMVRLSLSK